MRKRKRSHFTKPPVGARIKLLNPINRGLLGWWLFNEGSGSRIHDISGNGNHGVATTGNSSTAWGGSRHGRSFILDGSSDFIRVARGNTLRPLDSVSVVAVMNGTGADDGNSVITHMNAANRVAWGIENTTIVGNRMLVTLSDNGLLDPGNYKFWRNHASVICFDESWRNIAITFNGPTSVLSLYTDGIIDAAAVPVNNDAITTLFDSNQDIYFGCRGDELKQWDGSFSDIKIYNRALSSREIQTLNANPYGGLAA